MWALCTIWKLLSLGLGIVPQPEIGPVSQNCASVHFGVLLWNKTPRTQPSVTDQGFPSHNHTWNRSTCCSLGTYSIYPILTPSLRLLTPFNPSTLLRAGKPSPWERKIGPFLRTYFSIRSKGTMLIFTILILPIHEHGIFLHISVSSLISFISVL